MKRYIFWFHYNKPASQKYNSPKLTVHHKKTCYIVDEIQCNVKTFTHRRKEQPILVVKGKCKDISIIADGHTIKCVIT